MPESLGAPDATAEELVDSTVEFLTVAAPRITVLRRETTRGTTLELPTPDGAQFGLSLLPAQLEISARLLPPLDHHFFWSWSFRNRRYGTLEQAEAEYFRCVGLILANPTRIVQRRGLMATRFVCTVQTSDGDEQIGGRLDAYLSREVPSLRGRLGTYGSPPLLAASIAANGRQDR
jgi:hypothetical protein